MGNMSDPAKLEAGARRFALTLGRSYELALLAEHAQWCLANDKGARAAASARRFASTPIDLIADLDPGDAKLLVE